MHPLSQRPTYTQSQLSRYITHILPPSFTLSTLKVDIKSNPLATLSQLQLHHLSKVPWGNIAMHYSAHKTLSLDTEALFVKIVERGMGGYCMENNLFFATVLRSLGYELYITGGRVSNAVESNGKDPDGFGGWEHMVILVRIDGATYHVDVGFGSQGSLTPLLLKEGEMREGVPGNWVRLSRRCIAQNTSGQVMWVLETRNESVGVWKAGYCFSELEFLEEDFRNLNYRTHRDPTSWFTYTLVVTRVLLGGEEDAGEGAGGRAVGTVTLVNGSVNRRIGGGKSEVLQEFKSEGERVLALEKWFGVKLREDEMNGIVGMATHIRQPMTEV
jgi:arylamine N-acetyltransferase